MCGWFRDPKCPRLCRWLSRQDMELTELTEVTCGRMTNARGYRRLSLSAFIGEAAKACILRARSPRD
ncbi:hypothetical protein PUN4_270100 [Paraburkholderia unamae]|nr:hypothetical protein PUN4_270100 [Paraburkholderia unamae]